jgi:hypothetical protein
MRNRKSQSPRDVTAEVSARLRKAAQERYTIAEAFNFFCCPIGAPASDDEACQVFEFDRALRALAFLLHWFSEEGNKDLEGTLADQFGQMLTYAADRFSYIQAAYERKLLALRTAAHR